MIKLCFVVIQSRFDGFLGVSHDSKIRRKQIAAAHGVA